MQNESWSSFLTFLTHEFLWASDESYGLRILQLCAYIYFFFFFATCWGLWDLSFHTKYLTPGPLQRKHGVLTTGLTLIFVHNFWILLHPWNHTWMWNWEIPVQHAMVHHFGPSFLNLVIIVLVTRCCWNHFKDRKENATLRTAVCCSYVSDSYYPKLGGLFSFHLRLMLMR